MARRIIVASMRLPVVAQASAEGWQVRPSPGGLATVLRQLAAERPFTWIGWPGAAVTPAERAEVDRRTAALYPHAIPVHLDEGEVQAFYNRACNQLLWPLFHHVPQPMAFDEAAWAQYRAINERFADAIAAQARAQDLVWVHDYQLCLVPRLLRERGLTCPIGFFLHTSFPSWEMLRTLPARAELLQGMLGADLLGFHNYQYIDEFRRACLRLLDQDSDPESVPLPTHTARLAALPIGIDVEQIRGLAQSTQTESELAGLRQRFAGQRVVLGVDRLDATKGLPQKLLAFERLLQQKPEWRGKAVLIQVAAPSRTDVPEYQALGREIDEIVGRINGRHGTATWTPVVYINQSASLQQLTALYQLADVLFVASLRDGMNVVCLEYVAARGSRAGTVLLSELAGAASYLSGARLVNPCDGGGMAQVLGEALEVPSSGPAFQQMVEFVTTHTAAIWSQRFLAQLEQTRADRRAQRVRINRLEEKLALGERPLFLLSYDGTLRSHIRIPADAAPTARLVRTLRGLAARGRVYILSGRSRQQLEQWFGSLPVGLVCEHGLDIKEPDCSWDTLPSESDPLLAGEIRNVLAAYTDRTPGSTIEQKTASLAWHCRDVDPVLRPWRAKELETELRHRLQGTSYGVVTGACVLEVRSSEYSQGAATRRILASHPNADLVFAAGSNPADDELLETAADDPRSMVCHVGSRRGDCFVETCDELVDALARVATRVRQSSRRAA
jgi:trehalose 6-phosphate synthase/phosphatase